MPEDFKEAIDSLDSVLNGSSTPAREPVSQTPAEEMFEYYLGNKANKLPSSAAFTLKENGKIDKIPLPKLFNGYRMNQQTSKQNMDLMKFKTQFDEINPKYQELDKNYKILEPYKKMDDWSKKLQLSNPGGYKFLMDTIDQLEKGTFQTNAPNGEQNVLHGTITQQAQQIKELLDWKNQFTQEKENQKMQEDTKLVSGEIEDHKKKFPEINLDEPDENGIPLSTKVIDFGVEKGYQNFTDAYSAYFRDKLPEIFMQRGKNEAMSGLKKDNAKGILARSSKPFLSGHPLKPENESKQILAEFEALINQ